MKKEDVDSAIANLSALRYWYQRVDVDGAVTPVFNGEMADTAFYNQGKWKHFIRPLVPFDPAGKSFVECGCNAGLFLLLAAKMGFSQVLGLEGDDGWFRQARFVLDHYQQRAPEDYNRVRLSHCRIGETGGGASPSCTMQSSCPAMAWSDIPSADLTLLANVLYWMERRSAIRYIHELARTSGYCIVVSIDGSYRYGGPCSQEEVRLAFRQDWEAIREIASPELRQGEKGRDMFSILFRSRCSGTQTLEAARS